MRFKDKTMLVTGGAMGIGAATAKRLAEEGAEVVVADCNEDAGNECVAFMRKSGGKALFQFVDLSRPESIADMGTALAERFSAMHGLVNNCGIIQRATIEETGDADWTPQIDINLRAPALCAQALLPMLKKGPGHIVNISSEGGYRPRAHHWVYDATKIAVCSLARSMASEFADFGMRANSVAPGYTVTEMHFLGADDPLAKKTEMEEATYGGAIMGRIGRPEEIAAAIAFLLSDDASYITATTLHVDGGRVAH